MQTTAGQCPRVITERATARPTPKVPRLSPRIAESLSLFRNARQVPAALRRPSRTTWAAAGAAVTTATLAAAAVIGGTGALAPAGAAQAITTAKSYPGVSPVVASAISGRPASGPAAVAASAVSQPGAPGTHLTVKLHAPAGQPNQAAATSQQPAAPASPQQAAAPAPAPTASAQPYRIYDSVSPSQIPAHEAAALYSNGSYAANPSQVGQLGHQLWIDVTGYNYSASVLDVEPGDATPAQAASWAYHRLSQHPDALARIYTFQNQWPAVKQAIAGLPSWMQARVHWWIADPTGVPHMVQGANATQWYWGSNYDQSTAMPGF